MPRCCGRGFVRDRCLTHLDLFIGKATREVDASERTIRRGQDGVQTFSPPSWNRGACSTSCASSRRDCRSRRRRRRKSWPRATPSPSPTATSWKISPRPWRCWPWSSGAAASATTSAGRAGQAALATPLAGCSPGGARHYNRPGLSCSSSSGSRFGARRLSWNVIEQRESYTRKVTGSHKMFKRNLDVSAYKIIERDGPRHQQRLKAKASPPREQGPRDCPPAEQPRAPRAHEGGHKKLQSLRRRASASRAS